MVLKLMSIEQILNLVIGIIQEKRIIFEYKDDKKLCMMIESILRLIEPF
jgi:hypothetical protein